MQIRRVRFRLGSSTVVRERDAAWKTGSSMRWWRAWPAALPGAAPLPHWLRRAPVSGSETLRRAGRTRRSRSAATGKRSRSRRRKSKNTSSPAIRLAHARRREPRCAQPPHPGRHAVNPAPQTSAPGLIAALMPAPTVRSLILTVAPAFARRFRHAAPARAAPSFSVSRAWQALRRARQPVPRPAAQGRRSLAVTAEAPFATLAPMLAGLRASRRQWLARAAPVSLAVSKSLAVAALWIRPSAARSVAARGMGRVVRAPMTAAPERSARVLSLHWVAAAFLLRDRLPET